MDSSSEVEQCYSLACSLIPTTEVKPIETLRTSAYQLGLCSDNTRTAFQDAYVHCVAKISGGYVIYGENFGQPRLLYIYDDNKKLPTDGYSRQPRINLFFAVAIPEPKSNSKDCVIM